MMHSLSVTPVGRPALNTANSLRNTPNIYVLISITTATFLKINLTQISTWQYLYSTSQLHRTHSYTLCPGYHNKKGSEARRM